MKHIVIPETITLFSRNGERVMSVDENKNRKPYDPVVFGPFLFDQVCASSHVGRGGEAARRVRKLEKLLLDAKPGDVVAIEDTDYKVIERVIAEVEWPHAALSSQFLPFIEAIEDAAKQDEAWKRTRDEKNKNGKAADDARPAVQAEA